MMSLTLINARLNTQLARVRPGDITTNNRLVGAINANESKRQLFQGARQRQVDQVRSVRSKTNEVREAYVQAIIDLRTAADSIAKDVECAVLGAEAINAPPLLGMSFLANFTFKVDASKGTLTMVRVK